jgi:hypothetical protein
MALFKSKKKTLKDLKRKAPKVPGNTCPQIDDVLQWLERIQFGQSTFTQYRHDQLMKKMERLRTANERLRESGIYWYEACKEKFKSK